MNPDDRQQPISEPYEIEGWTHFTFPGRNNQYSDFQWHWHHFSGTDYDAKNKETGVFMILGENKGWADNESVDSEYGNYDYLMFTDIDYKHPDVTAHVRDWLKWFVDTTGVTGLRLDAIKHIDQNFMRELIQYAKELYGDEFYVFGEYWHGDFDTKDNYLTSTDFTFDLVDVGLHMNFFNAAQAGEGYDLTQIFQGSLVEYIPTLTVTFVDNHDTQRGQSLQSTVDDWFKPMAYGIILLRERGLPCVFYGDYYGIDGEFGQASFREVIDKLLYLRGHHAYGEQIDYLDDPNCIGWTRLGNEEHPDGLAAIISNSAEAEKRMHVGILNASKTFVDYLGHHDAEIQIDEKGWAVFPVRGGSISVWAVKQM
ncbi:MULTISPECIES: alpha-amylase [Neisseria]|uniref:alpha-amylase n=1 Tax=Neisseria TaxID=482 RepID=UPI0018E1FC45|nr:MULTISPECIES: alpha-amylase [Neisseria]